MYVIMYSELTDEDIAELKLLAPKAAVLASMRYNRGPTSQNFRDVAFCNIKSESKILVAEFHQENL